MNKLHSDFITEVLKVCPIGIISRLFISDRYITKTIAKYIRKRKYVKEMCINNLYYLKRNKKYKIKINDCVEAGNLENMKICKRNGCPFDYYTFISAAQLGNLENMKWLKDNGCPFDNYTFYFAAEHGNLENMKWLKENGCPNSN